MPGNRARQHNRAVDIQLLPANQYRRERWKNGLGWTREIYRAPAPADQWDWRLSIAEVERDGPFSSFPGIDRELVLLAGEGMRLVFDDGENVALMPPHGRHRFAGERTLHAELVAGRTQDFNLMWRRDKVEASLLHRPLVGPMLFFAEPGVQWAIHVMGGRALFKDCKPAMVLEQGDTALLSPCDGSAGRVILEGGGEVLLVRIARR